MKDKRRYLVGDVIKILGISRNTLYLWEMKEKINPRRDPMNKYRYWTKEDLRKLLKLTGR